MNRLAIFLGAGALFSLGGCMAQQGAGRNGHADDVPAARAIGRAESCIPIVQIQESRVRDDWTIDFRTSGNRWYRNSLPHRCNSLGLERAFSYSTSLSQLCSTDIIHPLSTVGGSPREIGACGLGQFVPVEMVR